MHEISIAGTNERTDPEVSNGDNPQVEVVTAPLNRFERRKAAALARRKKPVKVGKKRR